MCIPLSLLGNGSVKTLPLQGICTQQKKNCWRRRFLCGPCRISWKAISSSQNFLLFLLRIKCRHCSRHVYSIIYRLWLCKLQMQEFNLESCPKAHYLSVYGCTSLGWTFDGGSSHRNATTLHTQNKRTQGSMPWMGFEHHIPSFRASEDSLCLRSRGHWSA
jgi:hypothetical protein